MRGPFMPSSAETAAKHWAQPFLALLNEEVKLAGAYISCERAVHVQGPFQISDKYGIIGLVAHGLCVSDLSILLPHIFAYHCYHRIPQR